MPLPTRKIKPIQAKPVKKATKETDAPIVAKKSTKAATENATSLVPAIKHAKRSEEQIYAMALVHGAKCISLAAIGQKIELRDVDPRTQELFNTQLGLATRKCYTQAEEVKKIIDFFKAEIPHEFMPAKWLRLFERLEA